jgi:hypothetical protein
MFLENHADFDPSLLKMFINLIGVYPIGTLVYLSTEELALVIKPPNQIQDTDKPQIIILKNTKGKPQPNKTVNLATDPRTITRSVPAAGLDIHVGHYLFTKRS